MVEERWKIRSSSQNFFTANTDKVDDSLKSCSLVDLKLWSHGFPATVPHIW